MGEGLDRIPVLGAGSGNLYPGFQCDAAPQWGPLAGTRRDAVTWWLIPAVAGRLQDPVGRRGLACGGSGFLWLCPFFFLPTPFLYVILPAGARTPVLLALGWFLDERTMGSRGRGFNFRRGVGVSSPSSWNGR